MFKKIVLISIALFVISGCKVTPAKVVLNTPPTNAQIKVFSLIEQDELEALYPIADSSAASMQFGLVGALVGSAIDSQINKSNAEVAEENLHGIRNELIDLNFDKLFEEEIVKKLSDNIAISDIQTIKSAKALKDKVAPGETYLLLSTSYKMDIDFRTPFIVTNVALMEQGKKKPVELYKNTFTYFGMSLPAPTKTEEHVEREIAKINEEFYSLSEKKQKDRKERLKRQKAIKKAKRTTLDFDQANQISAYAWSTEYKEQLDANIREGVQDLFNIIDSDIQDKTDPTTYAKLGTTMEGYPGHHKSIIVRETDNDLVIRFTEGARAGAICSMPKESNHGKLVCL